MTRKYIDRRKLDALVMGTEAEAIDIARKEPHELNLNLPAEKSPNMQENDWQSYGAGNPSGQAKQALSEAAYSMDLAYEPPSKSTFKDYFQVGEFEIDEVTENFLDAFEDRAVCNENVVVETELDVPKLFGQRLSRSLDSRNVKAEVPANSFGDLENRDNTPFASMKSSEDSTAAPGVNSEVTSEEENREEPAHQKVPPSGQDSSGEKHVSRVSHANSEGTPEISSGRRAGRIIKLPSSLRLSSVGEPPASQPEEKVLSDKLVNKRLLPDDGLRPALRRWKSFQGSGSQHVNNDEDNHGQPHSTGSTPKVMRSDSAPLRHSESNDRTVCLSSKSSRNLYQSTPEADANKSVFSRIKGLKTMKPTVFDRIKFSENDEDEECVVQRAGRHLVDGDLTKAILDRSSSQKHYINHCQLAFPGDDDVRIRELLNCPPPRTERLNGRVLPLGDKRPQLTRSVSELNRPSLADLFSQATEREASDSKGGNKRPSLPTQQKGNRQQHVSAELQISPLVKSRLDKDTIRHKTPGGPRDKSRTPITRETGDKNLSIKHESPHLVGSIGSLLRDLTDRPDLGPLESRSHRSQPHLNSGRNLISMGRGRDRELASSLRYLSGMPASVDRWDGDDEFREDTALRDVYEGDRKKPRLESQKTFREWAVGSSLVVNGSSFNKNIAERELYSSSSRNWASPVDMAQPSFLSSGEGWPASNNEGKFINVEELGGRHPSYPDGPLASFSDRRFCKEKLQLSMDRIHHKVEGGVPPVPQSFWAQQEIRERLRTPEVGNAARQALKASEAAMRAEHIAMLAVEAAKEAKAKADAAKSMALLEEFGQDPHTDPRRQSDLGYEGMQPLLRGRGIKYF